MTLDNSILEEAGLFNQRQRSQGSDPKAFMQGKNEGTIAHGAMDDMVLVPRLIFRLVTLPILLPYRGWKAIRRRRQMAEFAAMRARNLIMGDRAVREITLEWVKDHPDEYILGEYDPGVPKLQRAFSKMLIDRR